MLAAHKASIIQEGDFVTVADGSENVLGLVIKEQYSGWFLINFLDRKISNQWEGFYQLADLTSWG
tara:strand:- start:1098 stop:1292 length:195 start_codon:yes stop_codon:yes gene_type:complete